MRTRMNTKKKKIDLSNTLEYISTTYVFWNDFKSHTNSANQYFVVTKLPQIRYELKLKKTKKSLTRSIYACKLGRLYI